MKKLVNGILTEITPEEQIQIKTEQQIFHKKIEIAEKQAEIEEYLEDLKNNDLLSLRPTREKAVGKNSTTEAELEKCEQYRAKILERLQVVIAELEQLTGEPAIIKNSWKKYREKYTLD